jgi:hypothetical protein
MKKRDLVSDAKKIAGLIANTDTDDRGVLLSHIATLLRGQAQYYTATVIYKAATEYGLPQESQPDSA